MNRILDRIQTSEDLKGLSLKELTGLCGEIREQMVKRLSITGGHVGSNLAVIEATVALHFVFHSPVDKLVFDVSHQCYTHKLLTGRKAAYTDPEQFGSVSGFTNPAESEHDIFSIGHTSTAVSLAAGLAKARDLRGETYNVIAFVGDGALSGGEALEGLNSAAVLDSNFILVINDNDRSIAENHGGLYKNLQLLRDTQGKAECNLFRAMGFDYRFIRDGNDVCQVAEVLKELKDMDHPVVVHMCTQKGKGYGPAELDPETWHYQGPFQIETGLPRRKPDQVETYEDLTCHYLAAKMRDDPAVMAVTAGTPKIFGFDQRMREQYSSQFVDVGIAEEHGVAFASGAAKNGGKPVFGVSSSFLQRAYDQLLSDLAINRSPAVILVFFAGISKGSQTHMGIFDIALIRSIPNLMGLAPTCREEYLHMLEWALEQTKDPVVIRVPGIAVTERKAKLLDSYSGTINYEVVEEGSQVAILALGRFFGLGEQVREKLEQEAGIRATLVNPRYINGTDGELLERLKQDHQLVVTLEDGVLDGGFGEMIGRFYGSSGMKVLSFGAGKEFVDHVETEELYRRYHLTPGQIAEEIGKVIL